MIWGSNFEVCHREAVPLGGLSSTKGVSPLQRQTQESRSEYVSGKTPEDRARRPALAPWYSVYGSGVLLRGGSHRRRIRSVIFGSRMKKPTSLFIYMFQSICFCLLHIILLDNFYFNFIFIPLTPLQLAPRFWFLVNSMPQSWHHAQ